METGEAGVTIRRPVEDVFRYVTRIEDHPKWISFAREARVTSPGPVGVGSRYVYFLELLGRRLETAGEVTVYQPDRRYGWRSDSSPFRMEGEWSFDRVEGGTRVTIRGAAEPGGFFRLSTPLVVKMIRRQIEADLANLKDLLEEEAVEGV